MKNINVCFLAAVACTYSFQVSANSLDNNLNFVLENNVYSLHSSSAASHTVTPLELKPICQTMATVVIDVCHKQEHLGVPDIASKILKKLPLYNGSFGAKSNPM